MRFAAHGLHVTWGRVEVTIRPPEDEVQDCPSTLGSRCKNIRMRVHTRLVVVSSHWRPSGRAPLLLAHAWRASSSSPRTSLPAASTSMVWRKPCGRLRSTRNFPDPILSAYSDHACIENHPQHGHARNTTITVVRGIFVCLLTHAREKRFPPRPAGLAGRAIWAWSASSVARTAAASTGHVREA